MLYLFGRLALSDSFYFNQDIHPDEQSETPAAHRQPEAVSPLAGPSAHGAQPCRGSLQPLVSPQEAESAS
jgi:hypothetical protein